LELPGVGPLTTLERKKPEQSVPRPCQNSVWGEGGFEGWNARGVPGGNLCVTYLNG